MVIHSLRTFPVSKRWTFVHVQSKIKRQRKKEKIIKDISWGYHCTQKYHKSEIRELLRPGTYSWEWCTKQRRKYNKKNMKAIFFSYFRRKFNCILKYQKPESLRAEAKDIFIGMVQESEIFEYLETGQHHTKLPWSKYFKISEKLL